MLEVSGDMRLCLESTQGIQDKVLLTNETGTVAISFEQSTEFQ